MEAINFNVISIGRFRYQLDVLGKKKRFLSDIAQIPLPPGPPPHSGKLYNFFWTSSLNFTFEGSEKNPRGSNDCLHLHCPWNGEEKQKHFVAAARGAWGVSGSVSRGEQKQLEIKGERKSTSSNLTRHGLEDPREDMEKNGWLDDMVSPSESNSGCSLSSEQLSPIQLALTSN